MRSTVANTCRFAQLQPAGRRAMTPDDGMQRAAAPVLPVHLHCLNIKRLIELQVPDAECQRCLTKRLPTWRICRLRCHMMKLWCRQHAPRPSLRSMGLSWPACSTHK